MSNKTTITLALTAGFIGGIASQRIMPKAVYAQTQTPALEIRAQSFVVVDQKGVPRGAFGIDRQNGWPTVEITDPKGHAYWARFFGTFTPFHRVQNGRPILVPQQ
jgi:hypothetical protein